MALAPSTTLLARTRRAPWRYGGAIPKRKSKLRFNCCKRLSDRSLCPADHLETRLASTGAAKLELIRVAPIRMPAVLVISSLRAMHPAREPANLWLRFWLTKHRADKVRYRRARCRDRNRLMKHLESWVTPLCAMSQDFSVR